MSAATAAVITGESVLLVVLAAALWLKPLRRRSLLHRRVLLQLVNRDVFDAILWEERPNLVVLRDVRYRPAGVRQEPIELDGEIVIERDRIEWAQVPPARAG
jgi:hypothetical protein